MDDLMNMPLLTIDRVLLPGERAAVPVRTGGESIAVERGMQIALLFSGALESTIGVLAEVESVRPLGSDVLMVSLSSKVRVKATGVAGSGVASVGVCDDVGSVSDGLISDTRAALRRYLAALSEYGQPVDLYPEVPDDPIPGSYAVASLLQISAGERQVLLEADDAGRRFGLLETILDRERRLLEATMGAKGI